VIFFIAHIKPDFLCLATKTSPNFPDPNFLPRTKSVMIKEFLEYSSLVLFLCEEAVETV